MHIHSNFSDGELNGTELLQYAKKKKLKKLSITDHDCVSFYFQPENMKLLKDFDYIVGCEFVCAYNDISIEILGYGMDLVKTKEYLDKHGVNQNALERYRSKEIPKVFAKHGIILDYDEKTVDFSQNNPKVLPKLFNIILSNQKAVEFLNKENSNLTKSTSLFLREGLNNPNSKIFIQPNKIYPSYKKIINIIKEYGGVSFLAHPYQYKQNMMKVLEGVTPYIDGIECYHFTADKEKTELLVNYCKNNNLYISGGSDFHTTKEGSDKSRLNELNVPEQYFDKIKDLLDKKTFTLKI